MRPIRWIHILLSIICMILLGQCSRSNPTEADFTEPELLWTFPAHISRSVPAITPSGTIYVGVRFSLKADSLYAIGLNGRLAWAHSVGFSIDHGVLSTPAVDSNNTLYIGGPDGYFYCIRSDGTLEWNYQTNDRRRPIFSTPALGRDGAIIFGGMGGNLFCLNSDGTLRWQQEVYSYDSTPAIGNDGTIYVGGSYELLALTPSGEQLWAYEVDSLLHTSSPAIDEDGTIYICSYDGTVFAINPDGTEKWHYSSGIRSRSSPVITKTGQILFTCKDWTTSDGYIGYIGSLSRTGELLWKFDAPSEGCTPVIGMDGIIYVGADNIMFALNDNGSELWRFEADHTISNSPVLSSDGTLYFAAVFTLYAFQTSSRGLALSPWPKIYADYLNTSRSK